MWPDYRTELFAIWRACERLKILPPGVKGSWDQCGPDVQCMILAYDQTREHDEAEHASAMIKAGLPRLK